MRLPARTPDSSFSDSSCALSRVLGDEVAHDVEVERELDAEALAEPRRDACACSWREQVGQAPRGERHFGLHQRHEHEEQREQRRGRTPAPRAACRARAARRGPAAQSTSGVPR